MAGSDPEKLMVKADKITKLSFTTWKADWKNAVVLYEQAAIGFRLAKNYERAKTALERASKGQELLSSPWDAAKHMESAGAMAKEQGRWSEVADFHRRASELYIECARSQPAADALAKGSKALEESLPEEAARVYINACDILEEDEKGQMPFDLYRAAASVYIKLEKYEDASTVLLRWGLAADKFNAKNSLCKAYLSAIIVYLYIHDFKQAEKCHNDCSETNAFMGSDQFYVASKLLSAYKEGDIEEIKRVAQSSTISNLDHIIIRLAINLPTGKLDVAQAEVASGEHGGDELDEDNLT